MFLVSGSVCERSLSSQVTNSRFCRPESLKKLTEALDNAQVSGYVPATVLYSITLYYCILHCILLYIIVYYCILLHITCAVLYTTVYYCILLYIIAYYTCCVLVHKTLFPLRSCNPPNLMNTPT